MKECSFLKHRNHAGEEKQPHILVYHITGKEGIFNRLSLEGYELLSQEFLSFIDLMRHSIPEDAPILLEITGAKLSEAEQQATDEAIWLHYRLRMAQTVRSLKACRVKTFWFLVCTVLSSIFLYMATKDTDEVAKQFFYLPIWFFGYRLLTFPLQESLPLRRELRWYRRLASMKLVFSETPISNLPKALAEAAVRENAQFYEEAMEGVRNDALRKRVYEKNGKVTLCCRADSAGELLHPCSTPGKELISEEFASFLKQAEPFVRPNQPAELIIRGEKISNADRISILSALKNYFHLYYMGAVDVLHTDRKRILNYTLGLIASSIVLYFCGSGAGLATHEFMVIALWFFGDYLVEYVLLGQLDAEDMIRLRRCLMNMKVRFDGAD